MTIETDRSGRIRVSFGRLEWAALATIASALAAGWWTHEQALSTLVEQGKAVHDRIARLERQVDGGMIR